jgi:membrane complex biogenesis BtpA family protein
MQSLELLFGVPKPLIGMLHLLALPGRPGHDRSGGIDRIVDGLGRDLDALQTAGVDGVLFCNEHDIPYAREVGLEASTAMASAIGQLRRDLRLPFGVDLLWDPRSAIAVARATGAAFVREVFTGVFESDMGLLAPDLGELAGYRHAIGGDDIALFANITPESSRSVSGRPVGERARGAAYSRVDALLISGPQAGVAASLDDLVEAGMAGTGLPVIANTGVTHENVRSVMTVCDGMIVGTSLKVDGSTWNPVDVARATRLVELVGAARVGRAA